MSKINRENHYDVLIIGDGLSAKVLLYSLFRANKKLSVMHVAQDNFAPNCSLRTTSVITRNGIERGISPLGDILVDAFEFTQAFFKQHCPPGVEDVQQTHIAKGEKQIQKLQRRFTEEATHLQGDKAIHHGSATIISAPILLKWLSDHYVQEKNYRFASQLVVEIQQEANVQVVKTFNGDQYSCDRLFVCTGAFSLLTALCSAMDESCAFSKAVSGSYLHLKHNLNEKGFVYSFDHFNFIYRSIDQQILIGGTTDKTNVIAPHYDQLKEYYQIACQELGQQYNIPEFEKFNVTTGIRHKGRKRNPYWGEVRPNIFSIHSLYKNGYTLAFLAAKDLLQQAGIL